MSEFGWIRPHIVWPLRKWRNRTMARLRQWRTGQPGWIVKAGLITACPHDHVFVEGWHWNFEPAVCDWKGQLPMSDAIDRMVMAFPDCVRHELLPQHCTICAHQETFA